MGALTGVEGIVAHLAPWAAEIATASVDASLRLSAVDDTSPQAAAQRRAVWSEFWWATGLGTAGTGIGFGLRGGTPRLKPEDRVPAAPTWADRGAIPEVNVALPTHLRIGPPDDAPFFDLEEAWMERGSRRPRSYA